jgi:hypothetical protein
MPGHCVATGYYYYCASKGRAADALNPGGVNSGGVKGVKGVKSVKHTYERSATGSNGHDGMCMIAPQLVSGIFEVFEILRKVSTSIGAFDPSIVGQA